MSRVERLWLPIWVQFEVGISTGLRVNELCSLRWRHLWCFATDQPQRATKIERRLTKGQVSARSLQIGDRARAAVESLFRAWCFVYPCYGPPEPEHYVFVASRSADGCVRRGHHEREPCRITNRQARNRLKKLFAAAGLDLHRLSTHSLRKSFAMRAYRLTKKDLVQTAALTGHRSLNSLQHYLATDSEALRSTLAELEGL